MKTDLKKNTSLLSFLILLLFINCSGNNSKGANQIDHTASTKTSNLEFDSIIEDNTPGFKQRNDLRISASVNSNAEFKQIKIELHNENGVPYGFDEDIHGYIIEGFDIDEHGKFYFLAGDNPSILTCFSNEKEIFRKKYVQFSGNPIHTFGDNLMIFDTQYKNNNLFVLDRNDGVILNTFNGIIENVVNNFHFLDSLLILRVFNMEEKITLDTPLPYVVFDFEGSMIGEADNLYNLAKNIATKAIYKEFMGKWKDNLVFFEYDVDDSDQMFYIFSLEDKYGKVLNKKSYRSDRFGESIYGVEGYPQEHRKIKNNNIYMLSREDKNAVITILPLTKLFDLL